MVFKKILAILIGGMVLCTSLSASVYAETTSLSVDSGIAPAYEIAENTISNLSISEKTAFCSSSARSADAISITVEQTLQKQGFLWIWSTYGAKAVTSAGSAMDFITSTAILCYMDGNTARSVSTTNTEKNYTYCSATASKAFKVGYSATGYHEAEHNGDNKIIATYLNF